MTVAIALPLLTVSDEDQQVIGRLRADILYYAGRNKKRYALYEGEFAADQIGIAVPPFLKDWPVKIGWGTTIVDVVAERINWLEFEAPGADLLGLDEIARMNRLQTKADRVTESTLVAGTSFAVVGKDAAGKVLIEPKSPSVMAVERDYVKDVIVAALCQVRDGSGMVVAETLYRPNYTLTFTMVDRRLELTNRDDHNRGEVPVEQFSNQPNDSHPNGRSLLTAPIEYTISNAVRTLLGMEVHREFYAAPQRAALGAEPEVFGFEEGMSAQEKYQLGWSLTMGRMNIVPNDEDGKTPTMHEFSSSSPAPFIEILKYLSTMVASDAGLPASYFGIMTDNPASADSIKALESRIERRSIARTKEASWHWLNVARKAILWRDGRVDEDALSKVSVKWASPSTPTPSAAADSAMKLVSAGILPAESSVTQDRIGLTATERETLAAERRQSLPTRIREAAAEVTDANVLSLANRRVPDAAAE
ncbi:phage portal protein [Rhodococcoides fascians]|uniref:phage portal protein n=1 Tax=Rhodococcoides fascians TaxID=1828 RepID=UPI00050C90FD|nr:phage portal protein [Rhodococcus fascians]